MLKRLIKVTDGLFRGSAPTPKDVIDLYKHFGIRKIVSLDKMSAERIEKICNMLGIEHVVIPLYGTEIEPLAKLFSYNFHDLLIKGGPTYVHCYEGKDRTGMVVAIFKCLYMGMSANDAIKEAKKIGFGIGLPKKVQQLYEKLIRLECKEKNNDSNDATMLDNSRDYDQNYMGSVIDEATMQSFAPFMDTSRRYPYQSVYNYQQYSQYPTRDNQDIKPDYRETKEKLDVPWVGVFDGNGGATFVGPVDNGGGFTSI